MKVRKLDHKKHRGKSNEGSDVNMETITENDDPFMEENGNDRDTNRIRTDSPREWEGHLEDGEVPSAARTLGEANENREETESGSAEEGEVTAETQREEIQSQVSQGMLEGGTSVSQKEMRYFTAGSVVCSLCGVKGHMSYSCTEEDEGRCFLCGGRGHKSTGCPQSRNRHRSQRGILRSVGRPREPVLSCYVCHEQGHLDCSFDNYKGVLSCANCGGLGHSFSVCDLPKPGAVLRAIRTLEVERKVSRKRPLNVRSGMKKAERKKQGAAEYHDALMRLIKKRPYRHRNGDRGG